MKDEWCPSPLSPKTHVQTDSALSGLCPVSKYRCRRSQMFTHVHLEETYMLLFDGSTATPSFFVVDDHWQALHVSCRGHWVTLTLTLNKGGRSSPWANGPDFWKICHTVENVEHRNGNLFRRAGLERTEMLRCVHVERRCQPLASELNGKDTDHETKFRYFSRRRRFVTSELRALRATEAEADIDVERKGSLSQSGVFAGRLAGALRRHASEKEQNP